MNNKRLTVMIGYSEFVAICRVDDPRNFGGFRVEADGLYVDPPPTNVILTSDERAAVSWHPSGDYRKPALPLPCTLSQLRTFLPNAGLFGCLDEEAVDALLVEREQARIEELPADSGSEGDAVKADAGSEGDAVKADAGSEGDAVKAGAGSEGDAVKAGAGSEGDAVKAGAGSEGDAVKAGAGSEGDAVKAGVGGTATKSRTAARIDAIVDTARQLGYDPMSVPYGGKAAIERECLANMISEPHRFTADTFKATWQAARDAKRIDVENAEIYRGQ